MDSTVKPISFFQLPSGPGLFQTKKILFQTKKLWKKSSYFTIQVICSPGFNKLSACIAVCVHHHLLIHKDCRSRATNTSVVTNLLLISIRKSSFLRCFLRTCELWRGKLSDRYFLRFLSCDGLSTLTWLLVVYENFLFSLFLSENPLYTIRNE